MNQQQTLLQMADEAASAAYSADKRAERALNLIAAAMEAAEEANQCAAKALEYSEQLSNALMRLNVEAEA